MHQLHPNLLLASLPRDCLSRLAPDLIPADLPQRKVLFDSEDRLDWVYFPEDGITSLILELADGAAVEIGMIGREGGIGLAALLGAETAPYTAMVQLPGKGARIRVAALRKESDRSPALLDRLLRFSQALSMQMAQTAACNAHHTLQERLARWLLMVHDRADGDALPMTQELMSTMLGVRRAGVTVAANMLHKAGAISYVRGRVRLLDRRLLEATSCECHGAIQEQYRRLLLVRAEPSAAGRMPY